MSWVTLEDAVRAIIHLLDHPELSGPVNVVAPEPVTNNEFSRTVAGVLHRPAFLRVPTPVLRMVLGEMADELLLSSQRAFPRFLEKSGFHFQYPRLDTALARLLQQRS